MIVVRVMEGLGNQMLQYALGRNLCLKNGSKLFLDLHWFEKNKRKDFPREFRLDRFHTNYEKVDLNKVIWRLRYTDHFKKVNPFKLKNIRDENYETFDPKVLMAGDNVLLEGFFANYKYFEDIKDILVEEFTPIEKLDDINLSYIDKIRKCISVSVHIRRGDFALTQFHGILDKAYYDKAIDMVAEKAGPINLFVFSDEPAWVRANFDFNYPSEIISHNLDDKNYLDMELMKHCNHNIIANSSFSWWPAWLNNNKQKIVVSPKKWLNQGANESEMIPDDWISI